MKSTTTPLFLITLLLILNVTYCSRAFLSKVKTHKINLLIKLLLGMAVGILGKFL